MSRVRIGAVLLLLVLSLACSPEKGHRGPRVSNAVTYEIDRVEIALRGAGGTKSVGG